MPFRMKELLVKTEQKITGKDVKRLLAEAQQRTAEAAQLLGGGELKQRKTAGGVVCRIICREGMPVLFDTPRDDYLRARPLRARPVRKRT